MTRSAAVLCEHVSALAKALLWPWKPVLEARHDLLDMRSVAAEPQPGLYGCAAQVCNRVDNSR